MREYKYFKTELLDNGIVKFQMNRPDCMNALCTEVWEEILDLMRYADNAPEVRVVLLGSAVKGAFIAGADIKEFMNLGSADGLFSTCTEVMNAIERCKKPTICCVNGAAFGAGFEIALACDIRIVTPKAKFGLPEVSLGVMPGNGGTYRLAKTIGVGRAKEVILAGRVIKGEECVDLGLAMKCVEDEELEAAAMKVAERMLGNGSLAMAIAKELINVSYTFTFETAQLVENIGFCSLMGTPDMLEGTKAFVEKRKPNFGIKK